MFPAPGASKPIAIDCPWRRVLAAAQIEDLRIHDLRHTFATHLLLAGVPVLKVSRWLGHTSIQITCDTYGHLLPDPVSTAWSMSWTS